MSHRQMIADAERHLSQVEPRLAELIEQHGPCQLQPEPNLFSCLVRSVVSQMISTKAAESISGRLLTLAGGQMVPDRFALLADEQLRACGLSNAKVGTIRRLTELFSTQPGLNAELHSGTEGDVIRVLKPIKGIGPWTIQMLQIFSLVRPDIWPVGDLGLQIAVREVFRMRTHPDKPRLERLARKWAPYRSVATWHLWRYRDGKPVQL